MQLTRLPFADTNWVNATDFANLAAADAYAVANGKSLLVDSAFTISTATTLSSNILCEGGTFTKSGSGTLAISGTFRSTINTVFVGFSAGDVTFSAGSVKEVFPEWFGAAGDSTTDDATAIQSAIDSIKGIEDSCLSLVSGSTYRITSQITTGPNDDSTVNINGNGAGIYLDSTTSQINIRNSGTRIDNLHITQNSGNSFSADYAAIDILNISNVHISRCIIEGVKKKGILVRASNSGNCTGISVSGCKFIDNGVGDISIAGTDASHKVSNVSIFGNQFLSPTSPIGSPDANLQIRAIHVQTYSSDVSISGNNLRGTASFVGGKYVSGWRDAIMIGVSTDTGAPSYVSVVGNTITGMGDDGVGISGATNITVSGNVIYGSVVTSGVYVPGDGSFSNDYVTVQGNTIYNCLLAGIFLKDTLHCTVVGNAISSCAQGIATSNNSVGDTHAQVIGNTIKTVTTNGVYLEGVSGGAISGNLIDGFGDSGSGSESDKAAIFHTNGGVTISGNTFKNGIHGILINGAPERFTIMNNAGVTLSGYGLYFLSFTGDNFIIAYNTIGGTSGVSVNDPTPTASKIFESNI